MGVLDDRGRGSGATSDVLAMQWFSFNRCFRCTSRLDFQCPVLNNSLECEPVSKEKPGIKERRNCSPGHSTVTSHFTNLQKSLLKGQCHEALSSDLFLFWVPMSLTLAINFAPNFNRFWFFSNRVNDVGENFASPNNS